MNKSSNVRSSCYTIVNDKLDIEVNITNRTFNFLDKTTFIYSTSLCLSRQQTWILPCLPSHWVTHIKYIYVIYTNTYKKKKRGRRADPFRNNSKRKTSRIDNWHQEKKENACLTRERTLSYTWRNRSTMMMINERERERAERSSRKRYYAKDNLLSKYYFRLYAFEKREKGKDQLNAGKISRGSARIIKAMFI